MKPSPFHFSFRPISGRMVPKYPQQMRTYLIVNEGQELEGDFYPVKRKRSNSQNNTVRGVWMPIIMEEEYGLPYTKEEEQRVYDGIKIEMEWTIDKVNRKTGEIRKFPRDTHDLDVAPYSAWMENFARHVAVNHGIFLPDPDPTKSPSAPVPKGQPVPPPYRDTIFTSRKDAK